MTSEPELNVETLQTEIVRLNKIIQSLMNRAERNTSIMGSNFNLFQTAITLEDKVRRRTEELEAAREKMEKLTRTLREKEYQTRLLIENSVSIHEIDLDGKVTFMNRAGLQMRDVLKMIKMLLAAYIWMQLVKMTGNVLTIFLRAPITEKQIISNSRAGDIKKFLHHVLFPSWIKKMVEFKKLMGITEDVTERKNAEEQLRIFAL